MPIDYGILNTTPVRPTTQVIQTPNYAAQNEQNLLAGVDAMNNNRKTNSDIALQGAQLDKLKQMLPGELQQQQLQNQGSALTNQGQALSNQKSQMDIQGSKLAVQQRQERMQAYQNGVKSGGTEAGLDAVQETYFKQGDTDTGLKMADTRTTLKQKIADNDTKGIVGITSIVHSAMAQAQKDPKTGQYLPGKAPLDYYNKAYSTAQKIYPNAPAPSSFKDNTAFEDSFVHPVLDTAQDYVAKDKAEHDELVKQDTYKAQANVKDKTQVLQSTITQYGPRSQEAKDAATDLQQAQRDSNRVANGNNYVTNAMTGGYNSIFGDSTQDTINKYSKKGPAEASSTGVSLNPITSGKSAATAAMPKSFNSKSEFQSWYLSQSPDMQNDIKANPSKYGLK